MQNVKLELEVTNDVALRRETFSGNLKLVIGLLEIICHEVLYCLE